ncbi:MAG: hypothetical protein MI743_16810 [Sneathiellales bacterium]|nr:hypothetical protein [Sneathiellales bacterium]
MTARKIETVAIRPIDCPASSLKIFMDMVLAGGEVPKINLQRGIPMAEMLFFTGIPGKIMGVGAVRFANSGHHKLLFEKAGVPQMYNPDSVEICWAYVDPEYRGTGVMSSAREARLAYLRNRPVHAVHRAGNDLVKPLISPGGFHQAGSDFMDSEDKNLIRLVVRNHDPVYDPEKGLVYGPVSSTRIG